MTLKEPKIYTRSELGAGKLMLVNIDFTKSWDTDSKAMVVSIYKYNGTLNCECSTCGKKKEITYIEGVKKTEVEKTEQIFNPGFDGDEVFHDTFLLMCDSCLVVRKI